MTGEATYDVVIIGAGPVGENVADRAVAGGLSAAIVERELVGGECSYWACMPTKALLHLGLESGAWLTVDDTLRVTDGLYAVGDVNHRALVTHQGKYQARVAGDAIVARTAGAPLDDEPWGRHVATADRAAVPQVVFTDPEVASAGLTASAAERAGYRTRVVDYDLGAVAGPQPGDPLARGSPVPAREALRPSACHRNAESC